MAQVKVEILTDWALFKKGDTPMVDTMVASTMIKEKVAKIHIEEPIKPKRKSKKEEE